MSDEDLEYGGLPDEEYSIEEIRELRKRKIKKLNE